MSENIQKPMEAPSETQLPKHETDDIIKDRYLTFLLAQGKLSLAASNGSAFIASIVPGKIKYLGKDTYAEKHTRL